MEEEYDGCGCYEKGYIEPHTCPYREDVGGDYITLCTCCERCMSECAADI